MRATVVVMARMLQPLVKVLTMGPRSGHPVPPACA